jgi:hypothetical protein
MFLQMLRHAYSFDSLVVQFDFDNVATSSNFFGGIVSLNFATLSCVYATRKIQRSTWTILWSKKG